MAEKIKIIFIAIIESFKELRRRNKFYKSNPELIECKKKSNTFSKNVYLKAKYN